MELHGEVSRNPSFRSSVTTAVPPLYRAQERLLQERRFITCLPRNSAYQSHEHNVAKGREGDQQEAVECTKVPLSDALPHPWTMMVVSFNTNLTKTAMHAALGLH
mmetsp:Transcript_87253/g.154585  ORF Transcript_87253/g.154585 Transcript_87253/m.154585 type:complete len:105 (-) Transcript_87253:510-824(-)